MIVLVSVDDVSYRRYDKRLGLVKVGKKLSICGPTAVMLCLFSIPLSPPYSAKSPACYCGAFCFWNQLLWRTVVCVGFPDYSMRPSGGFAKIATFTSIGSVICTAKLLPVASVCLVRISINPICSSYSANRRNYSRFSLGCRSIYRVRARLRSFAIKPKWS